jgi:hypothetical protein
MTKRFPNVTGNVWQFETARFTVTLRIEREFNFKYDGDDENGETQRALDCGDYVAFNSFVTVDLDGETIGRDSLFASVYGRDNFAEFWTAHRDTDFMNRNCEAMRAKRGSNVCICHYFPGMVLGAIRDARETLRARRTVFNAMPQLRENA